MKLDAKAALALTNLRASADFRSLIEWLKEDEKVELQRCVDLDGVALHRSQGAAKKLQQLFDAYLQAPSVIEKIRSNQG